MEKKELIEKVERLKSGLLAQATDGEMANAEYVRLRSLFMQEPSIKDHLPKFLVSNYSASDFRRVMQAEYKTYAERRKRITDDINGLLDYIANSTEQASSLMATTQLGESLGQGGFGEVYKCHNEFLDMDFAIKLYRPAFANEQDRKEGEQRFFREAKILFKLNHPNIVRIYDVGRLQDAPFIKMEYVDGYDLYGLNNEYGNLSFNASKKAIKQILEGLKHAHDNGIIHRDLKPSNIMLSKSEKKFK